MLIELQTINQYKLYYITYIQTCTFYVKLILKDMKKLNFLLR